MNHHATISRELDVSVTAVQAVVRLLSEGATVPFIARYRKEATGGLDEVQIISIRDRLAKLEELSKRRETIVQSLEEQGVLTDELSEALKAAQTISQLEDLYLPYRPKRRTRASVARERGLEPLAQTIVTGKERDLVAAAEAYVNPELDVPSAEAALGGARDIIAELASENAALRTRLRNLYAARGILRSHMVKGHEETGAKFRDYFDWEEPAKRAPSHRILALLRGEQEGHLKVHLLPEEEQAKEIVVSEYSFDESRRNRIVRTPQCAAQLAEALDDAYRRLLAPSMETEALSNLKERADREAIAVFASNLRELLLAAPLGQKRVLALDPGMRTGCKLVCLSAQGELLHHETIFPLPPVRRVEEAARRVVELCKEYSVEAIAVGNGTGGRETIAFLESVDIPGRPPVVMVNESGASVYSASQAARDEFPDKDVTVRGAVSIGRRLMDPLAELVKIDPKAIGVGQYQHDVDERELRGALDDVVSLCVNAVGVEVNTASKQLLAQVSGLSERTAGALIAVRSEKGPFGSREELLAVPGLGPKTYQQAAGFLRIRGADNPLDGSAVHPESYSIVEQMARDLGSSVEELMRDSKLRGRIKLEDYVTESVGLPTLRDISSELEKPGRDPREQFEPFSFAEGIETLEDVQAGMQLPGIVTNVTAFGAFVDVGVHQDGLVHISELADRFVRDPHEVVKVGQRVSVKVLEVDKGRRRISLSMK